MLRRMARFILALLWCALALQAAAAQGVDKNNANGTAKQSAAKQDDAKAADAKTYAALLERLTKGDRSVDFKGLRMAFAQSAAYNPYDYDFDSRQAMFGAMRAGQFQQALDVADKVLAKKFVDINAHFIAAAASRQLKNTERADFHRFVYESLIKSILSSGDGKSPKTAFVVISVDEEYALLDYLGLGRGSQALINIEGHSYDQLMLTNRKTNERADYFFNIDIPYTWLGRNRKK